MNILMFSLCLNKIQEFWLSSHLFLACFNIKVLGSVLAVITAYCTLRKLCISKIFIVNKKIIIFKYSLKINKNSGKLGKALTEPNYRRTQCTIIKSSHLSSLVRSRMQVRMTVIKGLITANISKDWPSGLFPIIYGENKVAGLLTILLLSGKRNSGCAPSTVLPSQTYASEGLFKRAEKMSIIHYSSVSSRENVESNHIW
jgi:hypothetical protein